MICPHRLGIELANRFTRSQDSTSKRMIPKVGLCRSFHRTVGRLIIVHCDLLQDDLPLCLKIFVSKCGTQHIAEQVQRSMLELRQDTHVVDRLLLARVCVGLRTKIV